MLNNLYVLPTELTRVHFRRKQQMTESNFKELLKKYKKVKKRLEIFQNLFYASLVGHIFTIYTIVELIKTLRGL